MKIIVGIICSLLLVLSAEAKSFFNPPDILTPEDESFQDLESRQFQGIPSLAVSPNGRLWAVWYAGISPGEDRNNYVVLATSADDGDTWEEVLQIDPDGAGEVRAFDPEVWLDPQGRLWVFWAQHITKDRLNPHSGTWAIITENPDEAKPQWTAPRRITEGIMMCKPTVLDSGRWLLPASTWRATDYSARAVASNNNGLSFEVVGACNILPVEWRWFDEHMFVELEDGTIRMLIRTKEGIAESFSRDQGATWSLPQASEIEHTSSRFFIRRLSSGNILLVKHGPIDENVGRRDLTAFISRDDGKSWEGGLLLDARGGVSYPDGQEAKDGTIYITYDFNRTDNKAIYMASFTEEDALAGKAVSGKVELRKLISQGVLSPPASNQGGAKLSREKSGTFEMANAQTIPLQEGKKLFSNRSYTLREMPKELESAMFWQVPISGKKTISCKSSGMLYFLTPELSRNKDSQSATLEQQGFEKVSLPEIPLFKPEAVTNYSTVYQKLCQTGEIIEFDTWAVPFSF
ncbi:sialidase family protein [Coraliomargarita sp. SDUM461004]|uniref:Sialidase family protein n=1 Tax=Thalassobacterium sedimentorum TaxID=3041258 RepID=A0ABU1ADW0_9BACT|nr:sialidase family protein [Coraliomargarita sp. SDUM461004]MDQ8192897.1 sialidase family protein [Coraliomargarita sp. SDUM461004]